MLGRTSRLENLFPVRGLFLGIFFGLVPNLNKLIIIRQSLKIRGLILEIFWLGLAVWFGLQNLNNVEHGDMTRQNFSVTDLILGIFLAWYSLAMCFYLPNLNKLWLGDMIRQSFPVRGLIAGIFSLDLRFGLVSKI